MKDFTREADRKRTKAEIMALLEEEGEKYAKALESLGDGFLSETVSMSPGGSPPVRTRFDMLMSVKEHELHHRGQLMLIQRMLGITPHLTREQDVRMAAMKAAATKQASCSATDSIPLGDARVDQHAEGCNDARHRP